MKMVSETLENLKGKDKVNDIVTGKAAFSRSGFDAVVAAMANDTTFKVKTYGKDGKVNGEVSISELIRNDLKKTAANAKYPQKAEAPVLDQCEVATAGLAQAIPYIVNEYLKTGKKFDLPTQPTYQGSVFLAPVKGKEKTFAVRDPKTQENLGTAVVKSQDHVQVRTKSGVPAWMQTKKRKDAKGNPVT